MSKPHPIQPGVLGLAKGRAVAGAELEKLAAMARRA
jgi:hypothetical protein